LAKRENQTISRMKYEGSLSMASFRIAKIKKLLNYFELLSNKIAYPH